MLLEIIIVSSKTFSMFSQFGQADKKKGIISNMNNQTHNITYTNDRNFTQTQVQELFASVDWLSAEYPERLWKALHNCETVITAWDGEKLVGLINALDDGGMTAYVHYLCIRPEYQNCSIGKELTLQVKNKYKDYLYLFLVAENEPLISYYEKNGFEQNVDHYVMAIFNK